jgi:hypothetical protein
MLTLGYSISLRICKYRFKDGFLVALSDDLTMVHIPILILITRLTLKLAHHRSTSRIATMDGYLRNTLKSVSYLKGSFSKAIH